MSFPTRSNHPHNARDHADSVIVHYKFHPLSGKHVQIVGTRENPEGDTFIVRAADGRRSYLPAWMLQPHTADITARATAAVSLAALRDLRRIVASILSSFCKGHPDQGEARAQAPIVNAPVGPACLPDKRATRAATPRRHAKPNTSAAKNTTTRGYCGRKSRKGTRR
jgi:hypothetical protein